MNPNAKRLLSLSFIALLVAVVHVVAAQAADSFKTIQNPGVTVVYGALSGQLSYQAALGETLKSVEANYGDNQHPSKPGQRAAELYGLCERRQT